MNCATQLIRDNPKREIGLSGLTYLLISSYQKVDLPFLSLLETLNVEKTKVLVNLDSPNLDIWL